MENDSKARSLRRRIMFAGHSHLFFDSLAGKIPVPLSLRRKEYQRGPDKLAAIAFDLLECLRARRRPPKIGEVRQAAFFSPDRVPQHPRCLSYWYDPSRHSLVGMHLGIDMIRHAGRYYIIENNLGTGLERRKIYDTRFDPVISGLVEIARENGFSTLVPMRFGWSDEQKEEFALAGREAGIKIRPSSPPWYDPTTDYPMTGLPQPLPEKTMYVSFASRNTPTEHFVHAKSASYAWIAEGLKGRSDTLIAVPETRRKLFIPRRTNHDSWPNLVIKLDGWDVGQFIAIGRFDNETQAREVLKLRHDMDRPGIFKLSAGMRLSGLLFDKGTPLFQEFIPPECDDQGHAKKLRLNAFVSPLTNRYLSANYTVSSATVPDRLPSGTVSRDNTFVVNFTQGAWFERPDPGTVSQLETVAEEFGQVLNRALAEKFDIGPNGAMA